MNHTSTEHHRDKISIKDIKREVVSIRLYAMYDARDVLEEYDAQYWVDGKELTTNRSAKSLDELALKIASDVVILEKIIEPWYDVQLVDGPLPREKSPEGFVRYTTKPDGAVKELISLLQEKKEELIGPVGEDYLKKKQTHKTHYPKRPAFTYRRI